MKLTKKKAQLISKEYGLGKFISIAPFRDGLNNFNYKLKTRGGNYVVRIIGHDLSKWKINKLDLERKVLIYLKKNNFEYDVPTPIKHKSGRYLSKIGKDNYWIYEMIGGRSIQKLNSEQLKELAKAMGKYHKFIKKFKIKSCKYLFNPKACSKYPDKISKKLKGLKRKTKLDKLLEKEMLFLRTELDKLSKIDYGPNELLLHGDILGSNVLFTGDKLTGIIDFENVMLGPRVREIAYCLRIHAIKDCKLDMLKMNLFLKEYEKQIRLFKKEKELIIPLMILENLKVIGWMYTEMVKGGDKKYEMIDWTLKISKDMVRKEN